MQRDEHDDREAAPTGMPDGAPEDEPLGTTRTDPDGDGERRRGPSAMPGIPDEGEPPDAG